MPYFAPESRKQNLITNLNTGAHQYKLCTRIMKKQVKDQIEKMVKECNEANSQFGETYRYEYRSSAFKRGKYSVDILFSNVFDSYDFSKLMDIITANSLHFYFAHRRDYSVIYLQ